VGAFGVDSPFGVAVASPLPDVAESEGAPSLPVPEDARLEEVADVELDERESFR
jgi:hypothetical protein